MYLLKKHFLHRQIENIGLEYRRFQRRYRRTLILRDKLIPCLFLFVNDPLNITRLAWSYKKNNKWWTEIVPNMTSKQFKNNFRVERSTFLKIVQLIGLYVEKKNTILREAIPVQKRIACALYTLGSTSELHTIANLFGIGKTTAALILHEFCHTLVNSLFHSFINFPSTNEEIQETMDDFLQKYGCPMCAGSLDGTHVSVEPLLGAEVDYYNYKKYHSIIMLATVNSSLKFTYINIGAPGRCNDSSVYGRSSLARIIENQIYANHYMIINNIRIQSHLIADSAFALHATLLKPYPQRSNMPHAHSVFNYRLSRWRSTVERAFGLLKTRFRCLHKKIEFDLSHTITIVQAATILHNICITDNDGADMGWNISEPVHKKSACCINTAGGTEIREALTSFFF
ncbi:unnamed protein product [Rotaria sp. Silwood2]|nr:unnamed protein product [Rotaria sp. Silwood2]CAF3854873.1 unnamed protein product [Rotaria sp. Silwood2]